MASIFTVAKEAASKAAYRKVFSRYEKPDYTLSGGLIDYSLVSSLLPRELVTVKSKDADLQGYFYHHEKSRKLVVIAHGLHACADEFIPEILFFYSKGYNVFAYDLTGCGGSGGDWMIGLPQFIIDIDYVLNFLTSWPRTKNMSKYLFGHSMGGFAVLSCLKRHKNIKAVAAVAAPNDANKLIVEKGGFYTGIYAALTPIPIPIISDITAGISILTSRFLLSYQKELFGEWTEYTALLGINSTKCPILLAHSPIDLTIDYALQSAVSKKKEFTNPNVSYYIPKFKQMGHTKILFSKEAIKYQNEIEDKVKEYKKEHEEVDLNALRNIYSTVDRFKYSELNKDLFELIIKTFEGDIKLLS